METSEVPLKCDLSKLNTLKCLVLPNEKLLLLLQLYTNGVIF